MRSLELFKKRGADHIKMTVLIDTDTTNATLTNSNRLYILRDILERWDKIKHPNIVILDGGYKEWTHQYPMYTINKNAIDPIEIHHEPMSLDEDMLESVEYPTWISPQNDNQSNNLKSKVNHDISMELSNIDITHSNQIVTPNGPDPLESSMYSYTNLSKKVSNNNVNAKPVIDRSNKPAVSKLFPLNSVVESLNNLLDLAKIILKLEKDILECENSSYLLEKDSIEEEQMKDDLKILCDRLEKAVRIISAIDSSMS